MEEENVTKLLGSVVKVDNRFVYVRTEDFSLENKSYILKNNKIFKTPYVGGFLKINSFNNLYIGKILSEKLFVDENNKYKIYKTILIGGLTKEYKIINLPIFNPQIGNSVFLFSNDELDMMESIKEENGYYLENLGTIKDSGNDLAVNIDLFSSNVLISGNPGYGKSKFLFTLYNNLFKNYIDKFKEKQKFLIFDLSNNLNKYFKYNKVFNPSDDSKRGMIIKPYSKEEGAKLFPISSLSEDDYYILGKVRTLNEKRIASDFFQWEQNDFRVGYLENLFSSISKSSKLLRHLQVTFGNLYSKRREMIKENKDLSKNQEYLNYAILNIYTFLSHLEVIEEKLYVKTTLFKDNKQFKKSFSSLYKYYKHASLIELTPTRFKWLKDFIFLRNKQNVFSILPKIQQLISENYKLKLNIFISHSILKPVEYSYDELIDFASKFTKNWKNIEHLFYDEKEELEKIREEEMQKKMNMPNEYKIQEKEFENDFIKNNVFLIDLNSLFHGEKMVATTIILKKMHEIFTKLSGSNKILNITFDAAQHLFNDEYEELGYYDKYKNNFLKYLLTKGKHENVYLTFLTSGASSLMKDTIFLFNNFFLFNITRQEDLDVYLNNFSIFDSQTIKNVREFDYGDFYCFGKNFIRLLTVHAKYDEKVSDIRNNEELTMTKVMEDLDIKF